MTRCTAPLSEQTLVDYWAGDLAPDALDSVEEHLLACEVCTAAAERVSVVIDALRAQTPPVIRASDVATLQARGMRVVENAFAPGDRREVVFPRDVDVLIHRLVGLDLTHAVRLGFSLHGERSRREIVSVQNAPFDRDAGAVLVACRQHYAGVDTDTVARLKVVSADGTECDLEYTILHRFE